MSPPERLKIALQDLEQGIRDLSVSPEHFIPDLVTVGLARDVFENATAVDVLAASPVPRAVYPNARAAFEASQDLALLVTAPSYDEAGALAFVAEVLDWWRSAELARAVGEFKEALGVVEPVQYEQIIEQAASLWDGYMPGRGRLLREARDTVQALRAKRRYHWSGLPRDRIHEELGTRPGSLPGTTPIYRSWYNLLSFQAHPSPRLDDRHMSYDAERGFTLKILPDNPGDLANVGIHAAFVASSSALILLRMVHARDSDGV